MLERLVKSTAEKFVNVASAGQDSEAWKDLQLADPSLKFKVRLLSYYISFLKIAHFFLFDFFTRGFVPALVLPSNPRMKNRDREFGCEKSILSLYR